MDVCRLPGLIVLYAPVKVNHWGPANGWGLFDHTGDSVVLYAPVKVNRWGPANGWGLFDQGTLTTLSVIITNGRNIDILEVDFECKPMAG